VISHRQLNVNMFQRIIGNVENFQKQ